MFLALQQSGVDKYLEMVGDGGLAQIQGFGEVAHAGFAAVAGLGKLSTVDRFLPVWIIAAMAVGLLLGKFIPGLNTALDELKIGSVSLPIAVGLLE